MRIRNSARLFSALAAAAIAAGVTTLASAARAPLSIDSARITIEGTSNIHAYTASTTQVRVTRAQVAGVAAGDNFWSNVLRPGVLAEFEVAVPAATLTSNKGGLDKNMHKALKVEEHPEITFRLQRFEAPDGTTGAVKAIGSLRIAGVEREVTIDLATRRNDSSLSIQGELDLLMTDFGIAPPKAMLGTLRTNPKVTVRIEAVVALSLT